jgi:hypothetical protein
MLRYIYNVATKLSYVDYETECNVSVHPSECQYIYIYIYIYILAYNGRTDGPSSRINQVSGTVTGRYIVHISVKLSTFMTEVCNLVSADKCCTFSFK